ncbi:MAG: DinB family protein [Saprospiraceae bacterium]|nr:DinB family protein [Saprospiraceae bacterium]
MRYIHLVFLMILSGSCLQAQQDPFLGDFLLRWQNAHAYTMQMVEAMPEQYFDFRPVEEEMTFGEQCMHMVGNIYNLTNRYIQEDTLYQKPDTHASTMTKQEILNRVNKAFDDAGSAVLNLDPRDLDTVTDFFAGPISKRRVVMLLNDHQSHHRGQMVVYLRLKGITPPKYVGW